MHSGENLEQPSRGNAVVDEEDTVSTSFPSDERIPVSLLLRFDVDDRKNDVLVREDVAESGHA
jgi:hypothetical protein